MSLIDSVVMTPLQVVGRIPDLIRSTKSKSLVDYTKSTRSEPITLVSRDLGTYPNINDVMQSLVSIYSGFYLQSIAIAVNVGRVDVIRILDKVNPNRDPIEAGGLWIESGLSTESYQLPGLEAIEKAKPSLESFRDGEDNAVTANFDRNSIDAITASTNLAVGKVFNVEISDQGQTATIPVSVRLFVTLIDQDVLLNILGHASKDNSVKESFYGIKSGRRKLISDGVFALDLIREHRKTLMKDKSGQYQAILKRANKNRLSGVLSLNPSVATASNIAVISKADARSLEGEIKGKLSDYKTRSRIFDNTYLMIMAVVDTDFDMITIYYNGIEQATTLSARDLKTVNKGNNMDVAEITRLLMLGQAPRY